ncbi:hypothetical protein BS50DRAFT_538419 [Corynespora cassiicola Philippines]|uniref:CENP-C homolog n=1 Tax=Corynespora cassiicola Philippines TaxID=1448308 RepID=A0A2T2MZQ2_CORCC|nr:hypothetical protein BS50DRAFT_538419 [Corynespora cassiicola Philippines]
MMPKRIRKTGGNRFYDVGVQGRETGTKLEERGSVPDLATSAQLLRNNGTYFPPPRPRSPIKTALESLPRRHPSIVPRLPSSNVPLSLAPAASATAVNRLESEQEDTILQETPALRGPGQRRGTRSIYPVESFASRAHNVVYDESMIQEEIAMNDESEMDTEVPERSLAEIKNDSIAGTAAKRGRKRKNEVVEAPAEEKSTAGHPYKRRAAAQTSLPQKKGKNASSDLSTPWRISKCAPNVAVEEPSNVEESVFNVTEQIEEPRAKPNRRGRLPKAKSKPGDIVSANEKAVLERKKTDQAEEKSDAPIFKKPKSVPKKPKVDKDAEASEKNPKIPEIEYGRLVNACGKPLSEAELDKMSTISAGSRYGRSRQLSVYRELDSDNVARIGRTGRHRITPIDFWKNDRINYDHQYGMQSIVRNESQELVPAKERSRGKGWRRTLAAVEEEQVLDPWEQEDGVFTGEYREFDPVNEIGADTITNDKIAWAMKGINPVDVPDASYRLIRLASAGQQEAFFAWGFIELEPDQMKRTRNSRQIHMVFHVDAGAVKAKIHDKELSVHKGGVFQVPRGNTYSIRNVSNGTSRIFFAQACELKV